MIEREFFRGEEYENVDENVPATEDVVHVMSSVKREVGRFSGAFLGLKMDEVWALKDQGDEKAFHYLVQINMGYVYSLLNFKYRMFLRNFEYKNDLEQEALFGLTMAVKKFDYRRDIKFTVIADYWIRKYLYEYLVKNIRLIRLPTRLQHDLVGLQKLSRSYLTLNNQLPSDEILSEMSGLSLERVKGVKKSVGYFSGGDVFIDEKKYQNEDNDGISFHEILSKEDSDFSGLEDNEQRTVFVRLLKEKFDSYYKSSFKERDFDLFMTWFGFSDDLESFTLVQLGEKYNISKQRVDQIIDNCVKFISRFSDLIDCLKF